ncbi:MAG TPA: hypothetical protein VN043_09650, partial [Rhodanobacter sp.]|nr:hypothetical protein [Rhodanobacter sp.]
PGIPSSDVYTSNQKIPENHGRLRHPYKQKTFMQGEPRGVGMGQFSHSKKNVILRAGKTVSMQMNEPKPAVLAPELASHFFCLPNPPKHGQRIRRSPPTSPATHRRSESPDSPALQFPG